MTTDGGPFIPDGRARELRTAEIMVAMFETQIASYEAHHAKGRMARRRERRTGDYDVTIDDRIDGLREGLEKWRGRVARLRAGEPAS